MSGTDKRYMAAEREAYWIRFWEEKGIYTFKKGERGPVFSIDTPPPTVSGSLHMGHCYSYSQTDFYARYRRMRGDDVFYPMGWDDNGLPTERLVEKRLGINPGQVGAAAFLESIRSTSEELEGHYRELWQRLGLSVDWEYTYSTIGPDSRRAAQYSFIQLYNQGRIYRASAPAIWCPHCRTAIAHAEVSDLDRQTEFYTLAFRREDGSNLPVATTRPELLAACVALFINPRDERYKGLRGHMVRTPLYDRPVTVYEDDRVEMEKGSGAVMCCTFGDATDIKWQRDFNLPLINLLEPDGRLNSQAGELAGQDIPEARRKIVEHLEQSGVLLGRIPASQTVSVHERCDTPVEFRVTPQWFIRVLDRREDFLAAGRRIEWHPAYMQARFQDWVGRLEWDWCISRQRYHGIAFPLWYCALCGEIRLAEESALPVDPHIQKPPAACSCGSREFRAETSVMDTWATSSLSPQIAGRWLDNPSVFKRVFPMSLRAQAHDIIRTWTFYTIVKSIYHTGQLPWRRIAVSGHGLSPDGHKVSKSRENGLIDPIQVMQKYSADAIRYWASGSHLGEDSMIAGDKIEAGQKLVNKLWSIAVFARTFMSGYTPPETPPELMPTDRWLLSALQRTVGEVTRAFESYDHAQARNLVEAFFRDILADNYLEMIKTRLYNYADGTPEKESARYALETTLHTVIKLLAPLLPYITEDIFQPEMARREGVESIHLSAWPSVREDWMDPSAENLGAGLMQIATAVRRYKSERKIPLGTPLAVIKLSAPAALETALRNCLIDISSVTRARDITLEIAEGPVKVVF